MTFAEGIGMLVTDICYLFTATKFCWWLTDKFDDAVVAALSQTDPDYRARAEVIANERKNIS